MSARKWLLFLGSALSAALLAAILWRLDWPAFRGALGQLRFEWLAAAMLLIVCSMAVRVLRWKVIVGAPAPYRAFWNAGVIGLLMNQIYPLRAGEVFRIFALRQLARIPLGRAATGALVDRLADLLLLGPIAVAVISTHGGVTQAEHLAASVLAAALVMAAGLFIFSRGDRLWRRWIAAWCARVSARMRERVERLYSEAMATTTLLLSPARLAVIVLLSGSAFGIDFAVAHCVLIAFGWDLPFFAAVTVLVFLGIGTSLPSAPGYVGIYQVACVFALGLFGLGESQAVAYSIVLQICVLVTIIALSGWIVAGHIEVLRSVRGAVNRVE